MWDVPQLTIPQLENYGYTRDIAYCPSNLDQNTDTYWTVDSCVTGYFMMIPRLDWGNNPQPTGPTNVPPNPVPTDLYGNPNDPNHVIGLPIFPLTFQFQNSSTYELASDATLSYLTSFTTLLNSVGSATNHIRNGVPQGNNTLFHDGHVEWRPFSSMYSRYGGGTSGPGTGYGLYPGRLPVAGQPAVSGRFDQWW
jgi:prepilin-type processing-associated H-X9-DG protein